MQTLLFISAKNAGTNIQGCFTLSHKQSQPFKSMDVLFSSANTPTNRMNKHNIEIKTLSTHVALLSVGHILCLSSSSKHNKKNVCRKFRTVVPFNCVLVVENTWVTRLDGRTVCNQVYLHWSRFEIVLR